MKMPGIVVAGSEGLIGREVCKWMNRHYMVIKSDVTRQDFINCESDIVVRELFEKFEIIGFVNCSYPKDFIDHCEVFMSATSNFAFYMSRNGIQGSIVNLSSIYGLVGPDDRLYQYTDMDMPAWYAAAKGAIIAYSRCLAVRYAYHGIKINCIAPGGVYDGQDEKFVDNRFIKYGGFVLLIIVTWMIIIEIFYFVTGFKGMGPPFSFWSYFPPHFGVIGIFMGGFIIMLGSIIHKLLYKYYYYLYD